MGYTHYMQFEKCHGNTKRVEDLYQQAIKDCNLIVNQYYDDHKGTELSLSGYSAHTDNYSGINFNGKGRLGHEDFILREHFKQNRNFEFCKTAQKPYDVVVTACLVVLKYYLKEFINISSDGKYKDFNAGLNLAIFATGLPKLSNPLYTDIKNAN